MCRRQTWVLQPAAKPGLCPATQPTKEPFIRGDDVNSTISRGKEKRAERRLLPPAVASGGPSQMVSLTLSAEPKEEKAGKKPPMVAAAMASWTQGGIPASQDATRTPVSLGTADAVWQGAMSLPLISNAGSGPAGITTLLHHGWDRTILQLPQSPAQPWGVPMRSNADLRKQHPLSNHQVAAGHATC